MNIDQQVARLQRLPINQLREAFSEAHGYDTRSGNKAWLIKRIAWRLQANAEGDLTERARRRAAQLACDADLRQHPPRPRTRSSPATQTTPAQPITHDDPRLPPPGSTITRVYKGQTIVVHVRGDGFLLDDNLYPSLSAVAKAITGSHCNGFHFFRLGKEAR